MAVEGVVGAPMSDLSRLCPVPRLQEDCCIDLGNVTSLSNHWHFVVWPETDGQVAKKKGRAMRANVPEWEPGRRGTVETLLSDFAPPFPASGRRNVGALPRKVSSCQTGVWDDARRHARRKPARGPAAPCQRALSQPRAVFTIQG